MKKAVLTVLLLIFPYFNLLGYDVVDTTFSGNHVIPETQSGFLQENYEATSVRKLQRGLENTFLCFLEVPHGVKTQIVQRRSEYLPVGIETFFLGALRGFGRSGNRFRVGLYEVVTFMFPQEPILEEFDEWLY